MGREPRAWGNLAHWLALLLAIAACSLATWQHAVYMDLRAEVRERAIMDSCPRMIPTERIENAAEINQARVEIEAMAESHKRLRKRVRALEVVPDLTVGIDER